ncbi:hypothetical protein [Vineibacter terrae]|uniref:hypothetical protein n=1 Tax=Vineibacter terrae TaxID=2586908 RepID=UPI002E30F7E5|nr:hypothetical protein [Vineibacter terrae]HEX2884918.1 hypothetical protein [Vineibacter terrae]
MLVGAFAAFFCLMLLETYLGYTGLRFGPIGSSQRHLQGSDEIIIRGLLFLYRDVAGYVSIITLLANVALYFGAPYVTGNTAITRIAHYVAGIGLFITVVLAFPFTNALDAGHVGLQRAILSASAALRALGSERLAVAQLKQDVAALQELEALLGKDKVGVVEREKLVAAIHRLAQLGVDLAEMERERNVIRRQPETPSQAERYLQQVSPPQRYPDRRGPGSQLPPLPSPSLSVTASDVVNADKLSDESASLAATAEALRRQRDELLRSLRILVSTVVNEERVRQDVSYWAVENIVLAVAALRTAEAIDALLRWAADLEARLGQRRQENARLRTDMEAYENALVAQRRTDADCSQLIADLMPYFDSASGRQLLDRVAADRSRAAGILNIEKLPGREPPAPRPPDGQVNHAAVRQAVDARQAQEGIPPAKLRVADLQKELVGRKEAAAGIIAPLVEAACRRGMKSAEMIALLENANRELATRPR